MTSLQELIGKHIAKAYDIDEYEEDDTQIIKWYKGKVTVIRNENTVWVGGMMKMREMVGKNCCQINGTNQQMEVGKKTYLYSSQA